ncbi:hypothetical protein STSP2_00160 [Anaerohalosphaera lusitana]|uniref:DUF362 domain-containing protein n=1 Tax=Anaerohalosphaera lusitana TaxID=1936003 RepID=A0A1U9NGG7_9BACT|nr:DUF362 domain-containing protein [Anaerohalosphaera lusitana]AQT67022.1 hypothetical protein STSP2_00160 [Anaerohalosphaera lusitana]
MQANNDKNIDRRDFMKRAAGGAGIIAASAIGAGLLYDKAGPRIRPKREQVHLPDFSVPALEGKIMCVAKGSDRGANVKKAIDQLGGIERFIKPGETVLIKPNVAFASPPTLGATTNPELIEAVVKLCYDRGKASQVIVTDNSINDPASCFRLSGVGDAAQKSGARIILPRPGMFEHTTLKEGKLIRDWPVLWEAFGGVDKVIGITPVKDHHRSGASMTMKNWYGLLGGRRNIFHQNIHTIIEELARMVTPTMVILDGTTVMMSNGPTGGSVSDLRKKNELIVCTDQVAADSYGASLLERSIEELPHLEMAAKAGVGTIDYQSLKPIFVDVQG